MTLLEIEDLTVCYGRGRNALTAVDRVSVAMAAGESLGVVGESGSGKSTLARAIMQIVPTASGRISVQNRDVTHARGSALGFLRDQIQMVFQNPYASLNPRMTIGAILEEALSLGGDARGRAGQTPADLLELVTLPRTVTGRYPNQLSGGQLQRVCIARALARKPSLLILDEVTSALDVSVQAAILNLLREMRTTLGLTYLCISHDLSVVSYLCSRVMVLYLGQSAEVSDWSELARAPRHPYTRTLLDSVPQVHGEIMRTSARGDVPDPRRPPSGCRFHTRCAIGPLARDDRTLCQSRDPHDAPMIDGERTAACHFPLPAGS